MAMKPDMEVLPGFTMLDPYAAPPLPPAKQALFDQFAPRDGLWRELESVPKYFILDPKGRKKVWKRAQQTFRWWTPTYTLKLTERKLPRLMSQV